VSGIFHILIGGLVIAMSVALFEFIIHSVRKKQKRVSISYFVTSLSDAKISDIE
jgi:isopenicillin N synthase-like dioxygenase